jgi:hypothetical protein
MTDFTNLAALVAQGQSLLDLVKGGHISQLEADNAAKLGEVDAALTAKIAQANVDIANATAPINDKIPRIQLTKNQELFITSGTVPDDMYLSAGVTSTLISTINRVAVNRVEPEVSLLSGIEADIKEQFSDFEITEATLYLAGFNVIRLAWDFGEPVINKVIAYMSSKYITGVNGIPKSCELSSCAFLKLESGDINGFWSEGVELGKWRFTGKVLTVENFGGYSPHHPLTNSQSGSLLLALPVTVSGVIDHPDKLFKNLEIS